MHSFYEAALETLNYFAVRGWSVDFVAMSASPKQNTRLLKATTIGAKVVFALETEEVFLSFEMSPRYKIGHLCRLFLREVEFILKLEGASLSWEEPDRIRLAWSLNRSHFPHKMQDQCELEGGLHGAWVEGIMFLYACGCVLNLYSRFERMDKSKRPAKKEKLTPRQLALLCTRRITRSTGDLTFDA